MRNPVLLIEEEPLAGAAPTKVYFDDENAALAYAAPRVSLFGKVELLRVLKRATTTMIPQTTLEER